MLRVRVEWNPLELDSTMRHPIPRRSMRASATFANAMSPIAHVLLLVSTISVLGAAPARAQAPPSPDATVDLVADADAELPDPDEEAAVTGRLRRVVARLEALQRPTRGYWGSWIVIMSGLTVAQAIPPWFEENPGARATSIVGASYSAAGLALVLASPAPGRYAARRLRTMPETSHAERVRKLAEAERLLGAEVASVDRATSWFPHVMAGVLSLSAGLALGFGYEDNTWGALRATFGTIAVIEGRVITRPRRARRFLDEVRHEPVTWMLSPATFGRDGAGMQIGGRF